ncbi:hypothetical protein [Sanguibacter massiliensis]|uniref:hypothetical protein n=1 Tax=Sanguibacter massiliensis TaxID=1973217 RepID=UPI00101ADB25|nr:hypothetical protein [Sanguibacter massiliensis]
MAKKSSSAHLDVSCPTCGSGMTHEPATDLLRCGSCSTTLVVPVPPATDMAFHAYDDWVTTTAGRTADQLDGVTLRCSGCGATTATTAVATSCSFCGAALVPLAAGEAVLTPTGIIPFKVTQDDARTAFLTWLHGRKLGVDSLREVTDAESVRSVLAPWWSPTARATTTYRGARGDVRGSGERSELVWYEAAGTTVRDVVGDPLVASNLTDELWDDASLPKLKHVVPYVPALVAGHAAARFDIEPSAAVDEMKDAAEDTIARDVRRSIGGDDQRIDHLLTAWSDVRLGLFLAPYWRLTYVHEGTTYEVVVDGRTGDVDGDFPMDRAKVRRRQVGCALGCLGIVAAVVAALMLPSLLEKLF